MIKASAAVIGADENRNFNHRWRGHDSTKSSPRIIASSMITFRFSFVAEDCEEQIGMPKI